MRTIIWTDPHGQQQETSLRDAPTRALVDRLADLDLMLEARCTEASHPGEATAIQCELTGRYDADEADIAMAEGIAVDLYEVEAAGGYANV